ncbi:MAG: Ig-like domain repeat protein, partial [Phyllobacteriaceae bacterium]|nr:Ig-like domain repeat protein [Phyllobacteriaceae bacterium]
MACKFIAAVKLSLVLLVAVLLSPAAHATSNPTTTTTLTVSQTSPGHYRAIIKVVSDVGNGTPGGGVIFWNRPDPGQPNNLENLAQLTLDGNGEVVYDFAWSRTGTSEFYALYQGQGAFWSSGSNFVPVTIASVQPTTTTVTPSINPAYGNLPFRVTVRVTAEDGSTPTGMVTLFDDNNLFNPPLDGGPVALVNGTATFTVRRDWLAGLWEFWGEEYAYQDTATYRAEFVGGPGFANSTSSSVDVRFKRQPMAVPFSASPNPAKPEQVVTFTGKAKSTVGDAPVGGDFAIYSDGQLVSEGHIASDGSMTGQMTYLTPGQHTVKLKFYVDSTAGWAPAPEDYYATITVANEDVTTTALQSSSSTPIVGEEVTFTATVANTSTPATTPTGTVEFFDGQTSLGTDDLSDGTASLTTAALALGGHSVTAKYLGVAGQFFESTSSVLQQTSQAPPVGTATTVTPSMNPAYGNLPIQVTVTVTSADGATTSGTVTLFDDNNLYNHPLYGGPVALVNGTATFTVRRDLLGAFDEGSAYVDTATFRAEFAGDPGFANSTSSSVDVRFKRQPLVITLAASPNPAKPGQVVTITGTVKSAVGNITLAGAYSIYRDGDLI